MPASLQPYPTPFFSLLLLPLYHCLNNRNLIIFSSKAMSFSPFTLSRTHRIAEAGRTLWVPLAQSHCSWPTQSRVLRPTARWLTKILKEKIPQPLSPYARDLAPTWCSHGSNLCPVPLELHWAPIEEAWLHLLCNIPSVQHGSGLIKINQQWLSIVLRAE